MAESTMTSRSELSDSLNAGQSSCKSVPSTDSDQASKRQKRGSKSPVTPPQTKPSSGEHDWLIDETTKGFYLSLHTPANAKSPTPGGESQKTAVVNKRPALEIRIKENPAPGETAFTLGDRTETRAYIGIALVLVFSVGVYEFLSRGGESKKPRETNRRTSFFLERPSTTPESGPSVSSTGRHDSELAVPAMVAMQAPSLTITPNLILSDIGPNQSQTYTLILNNLTSSEFTFELEGKDLILKDGKPVFRPAGETYDSVAANLEFSKKSVNVKPMQSGSAEVTVRMLGPTEIHGVLIVLKGSDRISLNGATEMTASLGALISFTRAREAAAEGASAVETKPDPSKEFSLVQWASLADPECHSSTDSPAMAGATASPTVPAAGGGQP